MTPRICAHCGEPVSVYRLHHFDPSGLWKEACLASNMPAPNSSVPLGVYPLGRPSVVTCLNQACLMMEVQRREALLQTIVFHARQWTSRSFVEARFA